MIEVAGEETPPPSTVFLARFKQVDAVGSLWGGVGGPRRHSLLGSWGILLCLFLLSFLHLSRSGRVPRAENQARLAGRALKAGIGTMSPTDTGTGSGDLVPLLTLLLSSVTTRFLVTLLLGRLDWRC